MKTEQLERFQQVSDLMDGRLQGQDFARAVELACNDPQVLAAWTSYHLVGDVLRDGAVAASAASPGLLARVRDALAQEVPAQQIRVSDVSARAEQAVALVRPAANDSRWRLLAGLASVAAVGAIVWGLAGRVGGLDGEVRDGAQLAQASSAAAIAPQAVAITQSAESSPQVMIRDPHLDALLAAHKQFGGASALQMPTGFVRNATFEGPSR